MAAYGDWKKIEPLNAEMDGLTDEVEDVLAEMMAFVFDRGIIPQSMKIIIKNEEDYTTVAWRVDE